MQLNITEYDNDTDNYDNVNNIEENANHPPNKIEPKKQISYEDILNKMNMYISNGKLYQNVNGNTTNNNKYNQQTQPQQTQLQTQAHPQNIPQNSYIYNKYFSNEQTQQPTIRKPKTLQEYKRMLLQDAIQRQRIKQLKSKQIMIPSTNIHFSQSSHQANLNKLFHFSTR